jgi:hypothetical protein
MPDYFEFHDWMDASWVLPINRADWRDRGYLR